MLNNRFSINIQILLKNGFHVYIFYFSIFSLIGQLHNVHKQYIHKKIRLTFLFYLIVAKPDILFYKH